MRWTPEDDAVLRYLWMQGVPASEIAPRFGVTRHSIIGRVHRLKLVRAHRDRIVNPEVRPEPKANLARINELRRAKSQWLKTSVEAAEPLSLTLLELSGRTCRWPVGGEKAETQFCGHPVAVRPYCPAHFRLSSQRVAFCAEAAE